MAPGQQLKIDLFFSVDGPENVFRLCAALCFFIFFGNGCKQGPHRLKKALKQTDKQRIFVFVPCVDRSRGDSGFLGDLVKRGFLKAVSKKLCICSPNDPVIQCVISIGHAFTSRIFNNGIIITLFFLLANADHTLFCKDTP